MSAAYRCTECDKTFPTLDAAGQCHWGIAGVVEVTDDDVEALRRQALADAPAEMLAAVMDGEPTWNTAQLQADFVVEGFVAPFVVVVRKSDGKRGTLQFTHNPRVYFGWADA